MRYNSIKIKITSIGAIVVVIAVALTALLAYYGASSSLEKAAIAQLTSIAHTQAMAIEAYFQNTRYDIASMAQSQTVYNALKDLSLARKNLIAELQAGGFFVDETFMKNVRVDVKKYYEDVLLANLKRVTGKSVGVAEDFMPKDDEANILQFIYTVKNPSAIGFKHEKTSLQELQISNQAPEAFKEVFLKTSYARKHSQYHPIFTNHRMLFGYYDIFIVDMEGFVVYTNFKELDFNTNLIYGPEKSTGLGEAYALALESKNKEMGDKHVRMTDFRYYPKSYNAPAIFMACPIFESDFNLDFNKGETKMLGVLIFQLPMDKINWVANVNNQQEAAGLGKTGEAFLLGKDGFMRTDSRFLKDLKEGKVPTVLSDGTDGPGTTVISLQIGPEVTQKIFTERDDKITQGTYRGYRGTQVLGASERLKIPGLEMAVVVQIDHDEILAPAKTLLYQILISGGLAIILGVILLFFASLTVSKPISEAVNVISTTSTEMAATVAQQEQAATMQSAAVNETTATMEELEASSRQTAEQAEAAAVGARQALMLAEEGSQVVKQTLEGTSALKEKVNAIAEQILRLSEQTSQIENIINLVGDLANQTNLLALNAAVEAARAGEHGRGFAVVAGEIRKLADQSKKSAERIHALVLNIQKATNSTVMATEEGTKMVEEGAQFVQRTAEAFGGVVASVNKAFENAQLISLNVKQQSIAIQQVVEAMNSLEAGAKETASGLSQTKMGIQQLNKTALNLKIIV